MAKIRGIKPEIWTDEKFVGVSAYARLLFIGMWNYACDNGHVDDSPLQLKMRVFPADNIDAGELITELVDAGLVVRDAGYLKCPRLPEHQRPDRRYLTLCDHCETDPDIAFHPEDKTGSKSRTRRAPDVPPTVPNNGHPTSAPRVPTVDSRGSHVDGDGDGDSEVIKSINASPPPKNTTPTTTATAAAEPPPPKKPNYNHNTDPAFAEFWAATHKRGSKKRAYSAWKTALKQPGVTNELLVGKIREYLDHVARTGTQPQFTQHVSSWLNGNEWETNLAPPTQTVDPTDFHPDVPPPNGLTDVELASFYHTPRAARPDWIATWQQSKGA